MPLDHITDDGKLAVAGEAINYGLLPSHVGYRIRKAYSHLFQTFTAMMKDLQLAPGQYSVLLLIGLNPGLSQMALAEAVGLDGSTIVPLTSRFVKLGWIRRTRRKDDRRFYALRITPAGQKILDRASPIIDEHERRLVSGLSNAECNILIDLLSRVTEAGESSSETAVKSPKVNKHARRSSNKRKAEK